MDNARPATAVRFPDRPRTMGVVHERWGLARREIALAGRPRTLSRHVFVHGSGEDPGSDWLFNGDFLVANGIAVLAFDKRGTGSSSGDFTFDFLKLAGDVAAAVEFLRTQAEIDTDRIGLSGYSQGGWVEPLAASLTDVRFVLVSYGMIESPAQEAQMEMRHLLVQGGVTGEDLSRADSLVAAAVSLVANRLEEGWEEFESRKRRFKSEPWVKYLDGTPVDQLLSYPRWLVRIIGPRQLPKGLRWHYDSEALLDTLCVPMTWMLAEEDLSAPNASTIPKLRAFEGAGMPYELVTFPGADHGMPVFNETNGQPVYTGYAPGCFCTEVEAALGWFESEATATGPCGQGPSWSSIGRRTDPGESTPRTCKSLPGRLALRLEPSFPQEVDHLLRNVAAIHDEGVSGRHHEEIGRSVDASSRNTHLPVVWSWNQPGA